MTPDRSDDLTTAYLAGFERGRDAEKAAIVAWLIQQPSIVALGNSPKHVVPNRPAKLAAAIERSAHHTGRKTENRG
ncbi:hypothetical protein SLG_21970 [Sphingobium sp. SYK-6]|uniref:hypothetical protein n=1 Tax=Sphingobium sp. (strain NBRC 103272 / SYK-6) TaxID=627192 RepID=UPI00022770C0|nr:hypothetical protein [Sphingobium sp. SYK-6]BAK66872.1 hypothetical protein SLG_21970 [Sphingobium sp. SYK-6]